MANHEIELQVAPMSDETRIILIPCFPSASVSTPIIIMQHKKSVILLMLLPAMSTS